jgi:hypothetical protein
VSRPNHHIPRTSSLFDSPRLTSSLAALPTATEAPGSAKCFTDQAGCPDINNTTYTSTTPGYVFLQICETNITSSTGKSIDVSSSLQQTWKECMDSCATYNVNVKKGGCQGATWQVFSTANPSNNLMCILKSSATHNADPLQGTQMCSGVLQP